MHLWVSISTPNWMTHTWFHVLTKLLLSGRGGLHERWLSSICPYGFLTVVIKTLLLQRGTFLTQISRAVGLFIRIVAAFKHI